MNKHSYPSLIALSLKVNIEKIRNHRRNYILVFEAFQRYCDSGFTPYSTRWHSP